MSEKTKPEWTIRIRRVMADTHPSLFVRKNGEIVFNAFIDSEGVTAFIHRDFPFVGRGPDLFMLSAYETQKRLQAILGAISFRTNDACVDRVKRRIAEIREFETAGDQTYADFQTIAKKMAPAFDIGPIATPEHGITQNGAPRA